MESQLPRIDTSRLDFSLLLLQPKQRFFDWLDKLTKGRGLSMEEVYFEEEDVVCIIPSVSTCKSKQELSAYLEALKPKLLAYSLGAFITDQKELPNLTASDFDEFFTLKVRDKVITPDSF